MKYNKSSGQVAKIFLALAIVIFIIIIAAYFIIKSVEKPAKITLPKEEIEKKATYEVLMNDIKFSFQESRDFGGVLKGISSKNPGYQKDLKTTEKFIMVTIGAQNKGKLDTPNNVWDIGNIIDSEGRNFIPSTYGIEPWLPKENACQDVLKPEFAPSSCAKIYEVAKISTGLKIEVISSKKVKDGEYNSSSKETQLIDLIITQ